MFKDILKGTTASSSAPPPGLFELCCRRLAVELCTATQEEFLAMVALSGLPPESVPGECGWKLLELLPVFLTKHPPPLPQSVGVTTRQNSRFVS